MDKIDLLEFAQESDNESEPVEIPQQIHSDLDINEATESNVRERTGRQQTLQQRNENRTSFTLQPPSRLQTGDFLNGTVLRHARRQNTLDFDSEVDDDISFYNNTLDEQNGSVGQQANHSFLPPSDPPEGASMVGSSSLNIPNIEIPPEATNENTNDDTNLNLNSTDLPQRESCYNAEVHSNDIVAAVLIATVRVAIVIIGLIMYVPLNI